jgi:PTS system mannose-specific IIB component
VTDSADSVRFALVRVDDRLLHGQVVYAWGGALAPRGYRVVDDEAAADEWTVAALRTTVEDATVTVESVDAFARGWRQVPDPPRVIVLLRDLTALHRLVAAGFRPADPVNLGGIRRAAPVRAILPYLQLDARDLELLDGLLRACFPLFAQDLPGAVRYDAQAVGAMLAR